MDLLLKTYNLLAYTIILIGLIWTQLAEASLESCLRKCKQDNESLCEKLCTLNRKPEDFANLGTFHSK